MKNLTHIHLKTITFLRGGLLLPLTLTSHLVSIRNALIRISSKNVRNQTQIFNQGTDSAPCIGLNRKCNDKGLKVCKQSQGKDALQTLAKIRAG